MSADTFRDNIVIEIASAVPNAQVIATRKPIKRAEDYSTAFKDSGASRIRGYVVHEESVSQQEAANGFRMVINRTFVVQGFVSIEDTTASRELLQDDIDSINTALHGNTIVWPDHPGNAQMGVVDWSPINETMFGSVLVWQAEGRLTVEEYSKLTT